MTIKTLPIAVLFTLLSINVHAAGSPINEDFSNLIALSENAIEAGKLGDNQAFIEKTDIAVNAFKEQSANQKGYSIRLPRTGPKLRAALKAAKAGDIQAGISDLENAIAVMQKE